MSGSGHFTMQPVDPCQVLSKKYCRWVIGRVDDEDSIGVDGEGPLLPLNMDRSGDYGGLLGPDRPARAEEGKCDDEVFAHGTNISQSWRAPWGGSR